MVDSGSRKRRTLQFGKYEVVARVAAGGMATVYKAVDRELNQIVALKILPADLAANPTVLIRFEREALAAAKLNHENIVGVYELGETQGTHFIAMEYVEGFDLHFYLRQKGQLEVGDALEILYQAARALDHAHFHGIVHRDIKPSNFLLSEVEGRRIVKLTDLGLAMDEYNNVENRVTRADTTVGTVDYMAPEQARSGRDADTRSDLYSLGCTFYHMLTGQPPFANASVAEKVFKHAHVPPPDPRDFNPLIPDYVLALLNRMLAKDPDARYQTPGELLRELEGLEHLAGMRVSEDLEELADGIPEHPQPPPPPAGPRDWRSEKEAAEELDPSTKSKPELEMDEPPPTLGERWRGVAGATLASAGVWLWEWRGPIVVAIAAGLLIWLLASVV